MDKIVLHSDFGPSRTESALEIQSGEDKQCLVEAWPSSGGNV